MGCLSDRPIILITTGKCGLPAGVAMIYLIQTISIGSQWHTGILIEQEKPLGKPVQNVSSKLQHGTQINNEFN